MRTETDSIYKTLDKEFVIMRIKIRFVEVRWNAMLHNVL